MTITDKIRNEASKIGETLTSLEKILGFGKSSIRKWDTNFPSGDKLKKVAEFLGISIDWLLDVNNQSVNIPQLPTQDECPYEKLLLNNFRKMEESDKFEMINISARMLDTSMTSDSKKTQISSPLMNTEGEFDLDNQADQITEKEAV